MGLPIYAQLDDGVCKKSIEVSDEQLVGVNIARHGEWTRPSRQQLLSREPSVSLSWFLKLGQELEDRLRIAGELHPTPARQDRFLSTCRVEAPSPPVDYRELSVVKFHQEGNAMRGPRDDAHHETWSTRISAIP